MTPRRWYTSGLRGAAAMVALLACACASIGNPGGGAVDEEPPRAVGASPAFDARHVSQGLRRAVVEFDELVNVKDAFSKVTVSPPPPSTPRVTSQGRKVLITFSDSLLPNTTYTVDFADAIEDVNEANPAEGVSYSFSTGDGADSLRIAGMVLGASDLEPRQGMLVGVHTVLHDSAFRSLPFVRIARTDSRGRFVIRGLSPRPYRVFALADANRDYRWDNPAEEIAFYPKAVTPYAEPWTAVDSVYNSETGKADTAVMRQSTRFLPNDLLLSAFTIDYKPQYLIKYERPDSARLQFVFGAAPDSLPRIVPTRFPAMRDWLMPEYRPGSDTISYWIKEPALVAADSLQIAMTYRRHASDRVTMEWGTDTLLLRAPKAPAPPKKSVSRKKEGDAAPPAAPAVRPLGVNLLGGTARDVYLPLTFEANEPIVRLRPEAFRLSRRQDTLWVAADRLPVVLPDTAHIRRFHVAYPWDYGASYRLETDSAAVTGLYGHLSAAGKTEFSTRKEGDYSSLTLSIAHLPDSTGAYAVLLNTYDGPVRTVRVQDGKAVFKFVTPGTYYARLYIDTNADSIWTTGDYGLLRQPEDVYYYPSKIVLRANWDVSQEWDIATGTPDTLKPEAIRKNKPQSRRKGSSARKKKEDTDDEEDDGYFDPTANPFDPNGRRGRNTSGSGTGNYRGGTVSPY